MREAAIKCSAHFMTRTKDYSQESTETVAFPNPRHFPGIDGIVYVGGNLAVATLKQAYSTGIFPWPVEGYPLLWHCPDARGILEFKNLHVPKSLQRFRRQQNYRVTFNTCFKDVIEACAKQKRSGQDGTWILPNFIPAYQKFHKAGYAHSIEVWDQNNNLVGGLYGVYINGVFSGESMFHRSSNASKIALISLIERLQEKGIEWMDIQMVTPLLEHLGGRYVSRLDFLDRLEKEKNAGASHKLKLP